MGLEIEAETAAFGRWGRGVIGPGGRLYCPLYRQIPVLSREGCSCVALISSPAGKQLAAMHWSRTFLIPAFK